MNPNIKFVILTTFFNVLLVHDGFAQSGNESRFGLKVGLNTSIFSASINSTSSFKSGLHAGFFLRSKIKHTKNMHFRSELYYSSQGQKDEYDFDGGSTTTSLNCLNVPILLDIGNKVSFQIGPQIGFLLSGYEKGVLDGQSVNDNLKPLLRKTDLGLVLGLGVNLKNFNFGARYNKGVSNVFLEKQDIPDFPSIQNNVFHFYLGYLFNKSRKEEKSVKP